MSTLHTVHLNGADAEAVANLMGGTLIMTNVTDGIATIAGGDPTRVETASGSIARVNDKFRRSGLGTTLTVGVQALEDITGLMNAIAAFDSFDEDSDLYGEHDFGSLAWEGEKIFWKIDYYDQTLSYGLEPLDPKCRRVMTVMLASEY